MLRSLFFIVGFLYFILPLYAQTYEPGSIHPQVARIDMDEWYPFSEGLAAIRKGEKWAFIDTTGKMVIPWGKVELKNPYSLTKPEFKHDRIMVKHPEKDLFGFADRQGNIIIPTKYKSASPFVKDHQGKILAIAVQEVKRTIPGRNYPDTQFDILCLSPNGEIVKKIKNLNGSSSAKKRERDFYINDISFLIREEDSLRLKEDRIPIWKNFKKRGDENGLITVNNEAKHGFIDFSGNVVIDLEYQQVSKFSEGLAAVAKRDEYGEVKWGFIDRNGKTVIDFKFSKKPTSFHHGCAAVFPKDQIKAGFIVAYINRQGQVLFEVDKQHPLYDVNRFKYSGYHLIYPSYILHAKKMQKYGDKQDFILLDKVGKIHDFNEDKIRTTTRRSDLQLRLDKASFPEGEWIPMTGSSNTQPRFSGVGYVNTDGDLKIPFLFEIQNNGQLNAGFFSDNRVAVKLVSNRNRTGYINRQGVFVIIKAEESKW